MVVYNLHSDSTYSNLGMVICALPIMLLYSTLNIIKIIFTFSSYGMYALYCIVSHEVYTVQLCFKKILPPFSFFCSYLPHIFSFFTSFFLSFFLFTPFLSNLFLCFFDLSLFKNDLQYIFISYHIFLSVYLSSMYPSLRRRAR